MPLKPVDPAVVLAPRETDSAGKDDPSIAPPGQNLPILERCSLLFQVGVSRRRSGPSSPQSRRALSARLLVDHLRLHFMISSHRQKGKPLPGPQRAPLGGLGAGKRATKPLDVFGRGA